MVPYQDMLLGRLLHQLPPDHGGRDLSPAMGQYLDMGNNAKADPTTGAVANENYARELMQLFTIGTVMLNQDGPFNSIPAASPSPPTRSSPSPNSPASTPAGPTRRRRATPVTGATTTVAPATWFPIPPSTTPAPSSCSTARHPAGLTPQQDLDDALDNIFNHPNVGPFVGKLLIQHLVKSNPSPAYISRVAAAFNNNGTGIRGDMQAVISAILLDPEARANDQGGEDQPTDGHLQEPALFIAGMVRAFGGR